MSVDQHGNEVAHKVRNVSWIAVAIMIVGFTLIGVATILPGTSASHATAWGFAIAGAAVFIIGGVLGLVSGIMDEFE